MAEGGGLDSAQLEKIIQQPSSNMDDSGYFSVQVKIILFVPCKFKLQPIFISQYSQWNLIIRRPVTSISLLMEWNAVEPKLHYIEDWGHFQPKTCSLVI